MSEGWASSAADSFDPWGQVPEEPAAKPPKEKKPPRDKKPVVEKKPPREKRSGREQSSTPTAESAPTSETKPQAENVTLAETPTSPSVEASTSSAQGNPTDVDRKKNQAYNNPERVKTGGTQRDKLSEDELTARMTKMREQNEKIKQRRIDVIADEDAFKKTQESERIRQEKIRKEQEHVNRTREQNARRKMDKIQSREWDSDKPSGDWKQTRKQTQGETGSAQPSEGTGRGRGGTPGRGRGRGRDRGDGATGNSLEQAPSSTSEGIPALAVPAETS